MVLLQVHVLTNQISTPAIRELPEVSYQCSSGQETITEDEAGRYEPVPTSEFINIYKVGMHMESTTVTPDFESNATKRARVAPAALDFDK